MQLTSQQLRQLVEEGYLFLPACFSVEEVAILRDEAEQIYATNRQEVWREKTGAPAPPSPRTPKTRPSACSAIIRD
jgi:L-proline 4-hydroxylase